ncbi:hypothetical protein ACQCT5_20340 [Sutcliffiella halmapala]
MTIFVPEWIKTVFDFGLLFLVISSFIFIGIKIENTFKIPYSRWLIPIGIFIASFLSLNTIHQTYKSVGLMENDIIISGEGEIIEIENRNDLLITMDEELFVFNDSPLNETILYEFRTLGNDLIKVELSYTSNEIDTDTLQRMFNRFAGIVDYDTNIPPFLSYSSYFDEVWKEQWEEGLTASFMQLNKEELSDENIKELILENEELVLNEIERNAFKIHLVEWE